MARGDLLDHDSLVAAMGGIDTAYYLVHSLGSAGDFADEERQCAQNFADAAREAGVSRIIYLGGLGVDGPNLSHHLRSRRQVGDILRSSGISVLEFRASIVIGSGSVSFEMVRALVERLPVMVTPRWVSVPAQPIAIDDLLQYLYAGLIVPLDGSRVFEVGGADVVSYGDLMREYARQRGLRRMMLPVPVLTPRLSSLWLGLVTPLYARVGAQTHRQPAQRQRGYRPVGSGCLRRSAHGHQRRHRRRPAQRGPRFCGEQVVGRTVVVGCNTELGRRPVRDPTGGYADGSGVRAAGHRF